MSNRAPSDRRTSHEIIAPPDELGQKCLRPGNASLAALEAISNAEAALEDLSVHFKDWMAAEAKRLSEAQEQLQQEGVSKPRVDDLFAAAHDLKGQGATLGYPAAAEVCASLCRLLEAFAGQDDLPLPLIEHHVDAVKAIVREEATGTGNDTANVLSGQLNAATDTLIAREGLADGTDAA